MSQIKVCNQVRLLEKDSKGLFKKDGSKKIIREGMKILDGTVKESEGNYQETGILYEVDEKATTEREKALENKKALTFVSA